MVEYHIGMVKSRSIVARVHCGEETEGRGWTRGKAGGAAIFVAAPSASVSSSRLETRSGRLINRRREITHTHTHTHTKVTHLVFEKEKKWKVSLLGQAAGGGLMNRPGQFSI